MKVRAEKLAALLLTGTLVLSGLGQPMTVRAEEETVVVAEICDETENCTLEDGHEGECVVAPTEEEQDEQVTEETEKQETTEEKSETGTGTETGTKTETQPQSDEVQADMGASMKQAPVAADAETQPLEETVGLPGKGTEAEPYEVASAEDLKLVAEKVNSGDAAYKKATYKLTADINLNGSKDNQWFPIGTSENRFTGTFIGTDYTISNLYIDNAELENAGLFGYIASPAKLVGITLDGATVTGKANVGTIAGAAFTGTAENCTVTGAIHVKGNYKVGGMFGGGYVKLSNCKVKAAEGSSVTGEYLTTDFEGDNVGGLIGFRGEGATITTTDCSVSGLTVAGSRKVGGIVGSAFADNAYTGCSVNDVSLVCNAPYDYASGLAKNQLCIGGIVGIFMKGSAVGTMTNCTVSNVDFSVIDPKVEEENLPIMGLVSGGYRASSFSGASAPDGMVAIEGLKVSGTNTGANADEKFPGSVAMNGSNSVFEQGTGTEEDPYMLNDIEDLTKFANSVTKVGVTYDGQYIKVADGVTLDLTDGIQIGSSSKKFMGTFDGNGVVLSNLTKPFFNGTDGATVKNIVVNGQTKALFGNVYDSTIQNMKLNDVNIDSTATTGALVSGNVNGTTTIEDIEVTGSITGKGLITDAALGGIIGSAKMEEDDVTTLRNCINRATIVGKNKTKVGGIYGVGAGGADYKGSWVVENCENYGDVSSTSGYAGGISGYSQNATFTSCVNEGKAEGVNISGGIVGSANLKTTVTDSKNNGDIITKEDEDTVERQSAGGIIGRSNSGGNAVSRCANTGDVTAKHMAGGIIGGTWADGDPIDNCYNGGTITVTGTSGESLETRVYAGGIYGYNNIGNRDVKACVNDGVIKADNGGHAYQIGYSFYYNVPGSGNQIADCYYIDEDGKIYLAGATGGSTTATPQEDMTRTQLADELNKAGGIDNFWQAQNDSVQPDPLIPGAFDDEELRVAVITDSEGNEIEAYRSLEDAVAAVQDGQTVKLEKSVTLEKPLTIKGQKTFTLDINGQNLVMEASAGKQVLMNVGTGKPEDVINLTLTDSAETKGKIESKAPAAGICVRQYSSLITKDVVIHFADEDHNKNNPAFQVQGAFTMEEGTKVTSTEIGATVLGSTGKFTMNGGEIVTDSMAVSGNGTKEYGGTEIVINGGTLIAENAAAIYHPQDGTLTLNGGEITGRTGVQICAGELIIPKESTVKVTGTSEDNRDDKEGNDGTIDDGAAISIINRDYPGGAPTVNIEGGTFVSEKTDYVVVAYTWNDDNKEHDDWENAGDNVAISGGTYNKPVDNDLLADGFGLNEPDKDGNYGIHEHKMTKTDKKDATCGEDGVSMTYYKCDACGKYFEDETGNVEIIDVESLIIPATGQHQYDDKGKCTVCGVLTADAEEANKVDALIDAIGPVDKITLDSRAAIERAKEAYEKLTAEQRKFVTGYDDLLKAIEAYNALLKEESGSEKPIEKPSAKPGKPGAVKTGDTANVAGYMMLMALAAGAVVVALRRKRRA